MGWQIGDDPEAFEALAGEHLRADPVAHTVLLGGLRQPGPGVPGERGMYAVLTRDGAVAGVAWRMPPYPLGVSDVTPDEVAELAALLVAERPDLASVSSVVGPAHVSPELAALVAAGFGLTATPMLTETLYRLDAAADLTPDPRPVPGRARLATEQDVPLLARWLTAFTVEAGTGRAHDPEERIRRALPGGEMVVWEDGDPAVPVCMVGGRPTGDGVARIGPVYTPPAARGRGYASAATGSAARGLFDRGVRIVTLYADDENPVSTGIYRRLGFRAYAAWREVALGT